METKKRKVVVVSKSVLEDQNIKLSQIWGQILPQADTLVISSDNCSDFNSLVAFGIDLCRKLQLLRNERVLFIPQSQVWTQIDLFLSRHSKKECGVGDTQISDILDIYRMVQRLKLSPEDEPDSSSSETCLKMAQLYIKKMKEFNLIDQIDVLKLLGKNKEVVTNHIKQLDKNVLVILGTEYSPKSLDLDILKELFLGSHQISELISEIPLDFSLKEDDERMEPNLEIVQCEDLGKFTVQKGSANSGRESRSIKVCQDLVLGYLRLLVNSRDELSLVKIICEPCGFLNHNGFYQVCEEAVKTKMPLYQTIVSYVRRLKLGGKSYCPSSDHPMYEYNKELEEFIQLMEKLQTKIEDEKCPSDAVDKILSLLKSRAKRALKMERVHEAFDKISFVLSKVSTTKHLDITPGRKIENGGSVIGRQAIRVIRELLDHFSTQSEHINLHKLLGKISVDDSETPLNVPSMYKLYTTPDLKQDSEKESDLNPEPQSNIPEPGPKKTITTYGCCYSWAPETSPIIISSPRIPLHEQNEEDSVTATRVECDKATPKSGAKRPRVQNEKLNELVQEIDDCINNPELKKARIEVEQALDDLKELKKQGPKRKTVPKRSILQEISNIKKKEETAKSKLLKNSSKLCKKENAGIGQKAKKAKKEVKLIKGQTKMTSYFRI